ncbi:AraC family transcriptional regulator [Mammaliicoccus sp. H-M32]|uniref:AraC family transcriptional regulator n=1 Tax=Mammaliicoccus sp. H-M32 TaxID=2898691 RepID=UPI001EFB3485|nr:AraC family transcriptional regulator [Mammaliicoccus sp. H-M32]
MYNYEITLHKESIINPKKPGFGALCFILEGKTDLTLNHTSYTFNVGELFYLQDNDNYLPIINNGLVAILHISYSMMESLSGEEAFVFNIPRTTKTNELDRFKHQIKDLFIRAILADLNNVKIRRSHYVVEIYKILYERFKVDTKNYGQIEIKLSSLIYKVKQYIDQHYHERLSLNNVASQFYISPEHLSREFSKQMGTTFIQYLKETRLFQATYALLFSQFKVEQIANSHGFSSYHNFNRQFKEQFHVTPNQYRLQYKKHKINKENENISNDYKDLLISKLQKMMQNRSFVHEYKKMSFNDGPLKTLRANHKTYLHIGDVYDFYSPFLGEILENVEKMTQTPIIIIHCSVKKFFNDEHKEIYKKNLGFCLSMFSDTRIIPSIKLYDIDLNDTKFKTNWHELIDTIHNYFYNKNGEIFFDINYADVYQIRQQIRETKDRLNDIKIMINAPNPFENTYEDMNMEVCHFNEIDGFALSYNFNSLYKLDEMSHYDIIKITNEYTEKLIQNMSYLKSFNKEVIPLEWNILNGDTYTSSDFYFNVSIMLKHLLNITNYISGIGFWLMEESSAKYASIEQPLSLYLKYHCKSPTNYLLTILSHFNEQHFYEGPNYVKFEIHNKIFFLLYNYELYHPHDINYQNNISVILSYRYIPFEKFRVTKITFDQDNGNIFKAIRKLDHNHGNLDYLNTVLLDRYCSPDIEMADYNSNNIDETYYIKTNGIKLLIVQNQG